jgi:hypothetical protein
MTLEKWKTYPEYQHYLLIANELNRAHNGIKINDLNRVTPALERAYELIDLTVPIIPKNKLREFLRLREKLGEIYINPTGQESLLKTIIKLLVSFSPQSWNLIHTSL